MSYTPRAGARSRGIGASDKKGLTSPNSVGTKSRTSSDVGSFLDARITGADVDMSQYGILGWKEYALLKYADNPKFYNSAVGKELIIESAMWEQQQKLIAIQEWADEVEIAAYELENNLRKEKKARLIAEQKLRLLQNEINRNPQVNMSSAIVEQNKESLVRSPHRAASPLETVGARTMSPVRAVEREVLAIDASRNRTISPLQLDNKRSPSPHRRVSGSTGRSRALSPGTKIEVSPTAGEGKKGNFASLMSTFLGRSKNNKSGVASPTDSSPPLSPSNSGLTDRFLARNKSKSSAALADSVTELSGISSSHSQSHTNASELEKKIERALQGSSHG